MAKITALAEKEKATPPPANKKFIPAPAALSVVRKSLVRPSSMVSPRSTVVEFCSPSNTASVITAVRFAFSTNWLQERRMREEESGEVLADVERIEKWLSSLSMQEYSPNFIEKGGLTYHCE